MANSGGLITAPVNTDDVSSVHGKSSHDVGTLCLLDNINKWNKNKPYRGTSPDSTSRTVHNANSGDNGSGVYCGNRGTATGFPVYWGLKYPMNNATQLGNGVGTSHLLNLCYNVTVRQGNTTTGNGHPNYEYQKPVAGTDFFRLTDFDGYRYNMECFLEAGVAGATPGVSKPAEIHINKFDEASLVVYAKCPAGATLWTLADVIPESNAYYLVVEFYKTTQWTYQNTGTPFKTVKSSTALSANSNQMSISVPIADIVTAGGFGSETGSFGFYACVGFVKYNGTAQVAASAFVAPWSSNEQRCATLVTIDQASPYIVKFNQYALSPSYSTYYNFTTDARLSPYPGMRFKATVTNNATSTMTIYSSNVSGGLIFRVRAEGNYGQYNADNSGYIAEGGTDSRGPSRILKVSTESNMSGGGTITIASNASKTLYFEADQILPFGTTTTIVIEVSNDGGSTWATTGFEICNITRNP